MALLLASRSPRRRELLNQIGADHRLVAAAVDETREPDEPPEAYVVRLAVAKARAGARRATGDDWTLGADTAVVVDGRILGKPRSRDDGLEMLALLAGREHRVLTGVALVGERELTALSVSRVRFRPITPDEAAAYWATGEPRDKAGGYAIQGLAARFVTHLDGSFSGVVGLPLYETAALLHTAGLDPLPPTENRA